MMKYTNTIKYTALALIGSITLLVPIMPALADYQAYPVVLNDPNTMVCDALNQVGLACGSATPAPAPTYTYQPKPVTLNYNVFGSSSNTTTVVATSGVKDLAGNSISLVQVPGTQEIYALVAGRKHWIPTLAIFYDYGYTMDMVESISQAQLNRYPRASLIRAQGDTKHSYYLTEGGMTRIIPTDAIFASYGDRAEDVIVISQKEFNYYPVNQYVYLESPLNRDVFQITATGKRYLTPMAVARIGLRSEQIAPINQTELNYYKTLAPIVQ